MNYVAQNSSFLKATI